MAFFRECPREPAVFAKKAAFFLLHLLRREPLSSAIRETGAGTGGEMPAERGSFFRDGSEKPAGTPREKTADEKCRGFEYNKLGKSFQKKRNSVRP